MRVLFYHTGREWGGTARAVAAAAAGLTARGHQATVAVLAHTPVAARIAAEGIEPVTVDRGGTVAGDAWRLRRVLQERFVEVVFVHTEREQLVVSSALRMAERGAVVRRIPVGAPVTVGRAAALSLRMTAASLLFSSKAELSAAATEAAGLPIPSGVAPLGVDVAAYDTIVAADRLALRLPMDARLLACVYDPSARLRLLPALRTIAALAPRHPGLRLVLLGAGAGDEELRMHAAALGIGPLLVHLGGGRIDTRAVLRAADAVWIAATGDDAAYAALDAMALAIPVIGERNALLHHFAPDGIAGLLLPAATTAETASTVSNFLADEGRRRAMGNAGRTRTVREFTAQAMIDGFERAADAAGDRSRWGGR